MRFYLYPFFILLLSVFSCQTGKLILLGDLSKSIEEASATETVIGSNLIWTIEDSGNKNNIYGLDTYGSIIKDIDISNSKNIDWEDLTSDESGNLYIGDFGNNSRKRKLFTIYKVLNVPSLEKKTKAEIINFKLPKTIKSKDFESFFLWKNYFYIFSKENKKTIVIKVPNAIGDQVAEFVCEIKFKGKHNRITSADINAKQREIILLNHDKIIKINNFKNDDFSTGTITLLDFEHKSQKEGICYKDDFTVFITDEYSNKTGGNIYEFKLE
ncbi:hypothetical protein [uncultured Lacinutrix sp.]|uniref:hypothetical protein n=1 Tax=uncultured Lacinutrix sp. TaxID=574032 RepID=UPI002623ECC6|nr:hypothetical protein [uncultured Lacinutrix sp.]